MTMKQLYLPIILLSALPILAMNKNDIESTIHLKTEPLFNQNGNYCGCLVTRIGGTKSYFNDSMTEHACSKGIIEIRPGDFIHTKENQHTRWYSDFSHQKTNN